MMSFRRRIITYIVKGFQSLICQSDSHTVTTIDYMNKHYSESIKAGSLELCNMSETPFQETV